MASKLVTILILISILGGFMIPDNLESIMNIVMKNIYSEKITELANLEMYQRIQDKEVWDPLTLVQTVEKYTTLELKPSILSNTTYESIHMIINEVLGLKCRFSYEIIFVSKQIKFVLKVPSNKAEIVRQIIQSITEIGVEIGENEFYNLDKIGFIYELYPTSSINKPITVFDESSKSPFHTLIDVFSNMGSTEFGLYQCIFSYVPEKYKMHSLIRKLIDIEFKKSMLGSFLISNQQSQEPSEALLTLTKLSVQKTSHPMAFFKVRLLSSTEKSKTGIDAFLANYRCGDLSFGKFTKIDFLKSKPLTQIKNMIKNKISYTYSSVCNTRELVSFFHIPEFSKIRERIPVAVDILTDLPLPDHLKAQPNGILLGTNQYNGVSEDVAIPQCWQKSTFITGLSGFGKSFLSINIIKQLMNLGAGILLLDPVGELSDLIIKCIPKFRKNSIFLDFSRKNIWPAYNPNDSSELPEINAANRTMIMRAILQEEINRAIRWGGNIEMLFFNMYVVLSASGGSFNDCKTLLQTQNTESKAKLLSYLSKDSEAYYFWDTQFKNLPKSSVQPFKNRLNELLGNPYFKRVFSSKKSLVNVREFLKQGLIVVVNAPIAKLGEKTSNFILSEFLNSACNETYSLGKLEKPFYICVDEVQCLPGAASYIKKILCETRKYNLFTLFITQVVSNLRKEIIDNLSNIQNIISFCASDEDSISLSKGPFKNLITPSFMRDLQPREAVVRVGTSISSMKTNEVKPPENDYSEWIIRNSIQKYYTGSKKPKNNDFDYDIV